MGSSTETLSLDKVINWCSWNDTNFRKARSTYGVWCPGRSIAPQPKRLCENLRNLLSHKDSKYRSKMRVLAQEMQRIQAVYWSIECPVYNFLGRQASTQGLWLQHCKRLRHFHSQPGLPIMQQRGVQAKEERIGSCACVCEQKQNPTRSLEPFGRQDVRATEQDTTNYT